MATTVNPIGQAVPRREAIPLLTGNGHYLDDVELPGGWHVAFVRSDVAHARLRAIQGADLIGADLPETVNRLPVLYRTGGVRLDAYPVLPTDRVRYVGQPLAACWAPDRYQAEDRAAAVTVDYEPLPVVAGLADARQSTTLLYPELGSNLVAALELGTPGDTPPPDTRSLRLHLRFGRSQAVPLEGRGIAARWDSRQRRLTVWTSSQAPSQLQTVLASCLGLADWQIRVITPDVGGGFGAKLHIFPEDVVVAYLAMRLGRPVKWVADRTEEFLGNVHARAIEAEVEAHYRPDGRIRRLHAHISVDVGAHLHTKGIGPAAICARGLTGPYAVTEATVTLQAWLTNTVPTGAYRGFGQPEAAFLMERTLDAVAHACGLDPVEIRRRNLVPATAMPFSTATGFTLDSGDYPALLERCVAAFDLADFRRRQQAPRPDGTRLGAGFSLYVEVTGTGPSALLGRAGQNQGGYETARVMVSPDGHVVCYTGLVDHGQGHATTFAQLVAAVLEVDPQTVHVFSGDTDRDPYSGYGTASSRSVVVGGTALYQAAARLREKLRRLAAALWEIAPDDVTWKAGAAQVPGVPARRLTLAELAREAYTAHHLPPGEERGLVAEATYEPTALTFAAGASGVEVAVDPDTGTVRLLRYVLVHDPGVLVNPLLADAQIVGGLAQGISGALLEEHRYDPNGNLLTATLKDYLLAGVTDMPTVTLVHQPTPSPVTPGGMKGVGEGGVIAPAPAILQAIEDALGLSGLDHVPIRPDRLLAHYRPLPTRS